MKTKLYLIAALVILVACAGCGNPFFPSAYSVGDSGPGGGIIFYDKGRFTDGWRYLEASPAYWSSPDYSYSGGYYYDTTLSWAAAGYSIDVGTGTGIGAGKKNTALMFAANPVANTAAQACVYYRGGGKSDWFLPSKDELNELYKQRDIVGYYTYPYSGSNTTYWSSSQYDVNGAWFQVFIDLYGEVDGSQDIIGKSTVFYVRPIRAF